MDPEVDKFAIGVRCGADRTPDGVVAWRARAQMRIIEQRCLWRDGQDIVRAHGAVIDPVAAGWRRHPVRCPGVCDIKHWRIGRQPLRKRKSRLRSRQLVGSREKIYSAEMLEKNAAVEHGDCDFGTVESVGASAVNPELSLRSCDR